MEAGRFIEIYPVLLLGGGLILGLIFGYLAWHLFFMGLYPTKKAMEVKLREKSLFYTPELGFTLADGGEKVQEKEEAEDEKTRVS
ncbi:MAG: hypothetical protein NZ583_00900 [Desulfobacterota bacterium]|nr:hypothetical protein [Thermodesulfobacteriota bacterium]MDW8001273.1 hypothetical protein [Deltaproteobacteria bacterium]